MCLQMDNGKEFDNSASRAFFATHGITLHLTCPYTSQQNGHAERVLRTLNDGFRALLFQAYSHYVWTFPLRHKSDVLPTLISFHAFVHTEF